MKNEILKMYKELEDYTKSHSISEVLNSFADDGTMECVLSKVEGPTMSKFCNHDLYKMVEAEKIANCSSDSSIGSEAEIIDNDTRTMSIAGVGDIENKVLLFKVSDGRRFLIDAELVFMVDGFYVYHEFKKGDVIGRNIYYLDNEYSDDLSYALGNYRYICSLAYRNNQVNLNYPREIHKPIMCKDNELYVTYSRKDNLDGLSYEADVIGDVVNNCTHSSSRLYYVSDDNRLIGKNPSFAIFNGFYLEVSKVDKFSNFEKIFYLGDNFEYALDIKEKAKNL